MRTSLEAVLTSAKAEAAALRKNGHVAQADTLERLAREVAESVPDYLEWIPEGAARLRSNRGEDFFKARRDAWAAEGNAQQRGRTWWYRRCVIEHRKLAVISRAEGRRSA